MRQIEAHKVNGCNEEITISVLDEPGQGGANHHYRLEFSDKKWGPDAESMRQVYEVYFQNSPIKEVGTNGLTHEALLAIVIDRMQSFQKGPYACRENAIALTKLEEAVHWLQHRTKARVVRGVEGTHEK